MTLASKITVLRILLIPAFVYCLLDNHLSAAQVIFCISVASDVLDGAVARWRRERTALGAFLDPLADKLLLVSTYVTFCYLKWIPLWVFVIVISRDLIVVLGWTVVYILTNNRKIEPRVLGKIATGLEMLVGIAKLFQMPDPIFMGLLRVMMVVAVASGIDYVLVGNKRLGELE